MSMQLSIHCPKPPSSNGDGSVSGSDSSKCPSSSSSSSSSSSGSGGPSTATCSRYVPWNLLNTSSSSSGSVSDSSPVPVSPIIAVPVEPEEPALSQESRLSGSEEEEDDCTNFIHDIGKWMFSQEKMEDTPTRKEGTSAETELSFRQDASFFIQEICRRLKLNQLCINSAVVFMNRFYMYHSFQQYHRNNISMASTYLAAKVEEQPRLIEHVLKTGHYILYKNTPFAFIESGSPLYRQLEDDIIMAENIMIATLGFHLTVDHPHTHVVKCCQRIRASKNLSHAAYHIVNNILQLTTMCLQHKTTVMAALAIFVASKWSGWEIPSSNDGKSWWEYVDAAITFELLEDLMQKYVAVYNGVQPCMKIKQHHLFPPQTVSETANPQPSEI